jgi:hypothetical protein
MYICSELKYKDFSCFIVSVDATQTLDWEPGQGNYQFNQFCDYYYNVHVHEHRKDNGEQTVEFKGEYVLNFTTRWDFPTKEVLEKGSTFLCFHSYKPIKAESLRLRGEYIIPAGQGAFCALGEFEAEGKQALVLNYMTPRDHDVVIKGNAKVLVFKYGEFVDVPTFGGQSVCPS